MLNKIYGIDFNRYACGGIGDVKLALVGNDTVLFYKESEMLKELSRLKDNNSIGEINVFESQINRIEYNVNQ